MVKEKWIEAAIKNGYSKESAELNYNKAKELWEWIKEDTASLATAYLIALSDKEIKLKIRNDAAEKGVEFTPSEINDISVVLKTVLEAV